MKHCIATRDLCASYSHSRERVLDQVTLDLPKGELISLLGPNGAGKSTLLKILAGIKRPLSGQVRIFGEGLPLKKKRDVAYIEQDVALDWSFPMSVEEVVKTGQYQGISLQRILKKRQGAPVISYALTVVQMESLRKKPIGDLSGGQKRRVLIARAIAQEAQLFLLDEPLVGVDLVSQELILKALHTLCGEGKTIVMATHDVVGSRSYSHRAILLNKLLIACGTPQEILKGNHLRQAFGSTVSLTS